MYGHTPAREQLQRAGNSVALGIIAPSDIWASTGHYGVKYLII
jgi:hypothetical protein